MLQIKKGSNDDKEKNADSPVRYPDGSVKLRNPYIQLMPQDVLYHLNLFSGSQNLVEMFGDVKFVCMGGTPVRMKIFFTYFQSLLSDVISYEIKSFDSTRCSIDKVGPVLFISHGMGIPSISIFLHEIIKLMYHAKIKDPILFKVGVCGSFGLDCGTVIISNDVVDGKMRNYYKVSTFGNVPKVKRPAVLDQILVGQLHALADPEDSYKTTFGKTMCTSDFYEEQGRMDGAFCEYTEKDRNEYLIEMQKQNVLNVEMQAIPFAAITHYAGIKAAIVCVTIIDKLKSDQITAPRDQLNEWEMRPKKLVSQYIIRYLRKSN